MVKKFFIGLLCLIWVTSVGAQAPTVAIDSPHTVSLLRGLISVEGTVDVPELQLFWLQVRALNETLEPIVDGSGGWMPITLPQSGVIVNGVLGQWDTMRVEDGLYELQLIAFPVSGVPVLDTLSPLRVENEKVAYVGGQYFNESILLTGDSPSTDASGAILTAPTVAPLVVVAPTVAPLVVVAPTVATGGSCNPTATAAVNANVRTGDSTAYSVVGTLPRGQQVPIIGRSSRSAWYVIRLSNGTQGFISPTTISIVGDVTCAPLTEPPALAFTSTPVPPGAPTAPAVVTLAPMAGGATVTPVLPMSATPSNTPIAPTTTSIPALPPLLPSPAPTISLLLPPGPLLPGLLSPLIPVAFYPDLVFGNYGVGIPPIVYIACGEPFNAYFEVKNSGQANSPSFKVRINLYRTSTGAYIWSNDLEVPPLDVGQIYASSATVLLYEGVNEHHLMEFVADATNAVVESDESNNYNNTVDFILQPNTAVCP